jgi:hypothetical protein
MTKPFHGAKLKIKWAEKHINDFYTHQREFIESYPYKLIVKPDVQLGYDLLHLVPGEANADWIPLVTGDVLHNLRTALDYAMNDAVFFPDRFTKFPVHDTRNDLENAINGGLKHNARENVVQYIVDTVQPYKGGNGDAIWALHAIDIIDKHRLLLAHLDFSYVTGIRAIDNRGEEFEIPQWLFTPPHIMTHRCIGHSNVKITNNGKAMVAITFEDRLPFEGKPILPTLTDLAKTVRETIDGLEAVFSIGP